MTQRQITINAYRLVERGPHACTYAFDFGEKTPSKQVPVDHVRSPSAAPCASWVCSASSHGVAPQHPRQLLGPSRLSLWKSGVVRCGSRRSRLRSVHYSDLSRHAARSRAQRPRSTTLDRQAARRTI